MTIYLTGRRNDGNFSRMEKRLRLCGNHVVSAVKIEKGLGDAEADVVRKTLNALIEACDAVFLLSDWQISKLARQDFIHAAAIKKVLLFEDFGDEDLCYG